MKRRTLLKLGAVGSATLTLLAGGTALWFEPAWRDDHLSAEAQSLAAAVARGVLEGTLPAETVAQGAAISAHLERLNATVRAMPPASQTQISIMFAILATPPGRWALAGIRNPWNAVSSQEVQSALQAMRTSQVLLRRQVYQALRDLTHAAYFADSVTWTHLGYPGPTSVT